MPRIDRTEGRTLFGLDPEAYDRARPDYPQRVYEILREHCRLTADTKVLEIGAGSGTATRHLLALGARHVTAVEPDSALAAYLAQAAPAIDVRVESFEEAQLLPDSFDLAISATAFHWIDQTFGLSKIWALLKPEGCWAMWWNNFGDPDREDPFHEATNDLLSPLATSPSHGERGRPPFALDVEARERDLAAAGFVNIKHELLRWTLTLDAAETRALYATYSSVNRLPPQERESILDAIAATANKQFGGRVERNMITSIYTADKPSKIR